MNILVKNYGTDICTFRPETTWEKNSRDFYPQEDITALAFSPVLCAHISRAGRSVQQKFASRYFDTVGYGVFLYDEGLLNSGDPVSYAAASCIDHTSFIPLPTHDRTILGLTDRHFILKKGEEVLTDYSDGGIALIERAIACATAHSYIRTGDFLCIELAPVTHLCDRSDGTTHITATLSDTPLLDFNIIM